MPRYTADTKDRVRDAVDFAGLVGHYTELRRAGADHLEGLCPFHDERTPSFGISPSKGLYHCFGCGAGGDVFTFVQEKEGLDFKGALEFLADRAGLSLEVEAEDPREARNRIQRERLIELLERTATFYTRYLWDAAEAAGAREYLAGRGLDEATLREFRVGYSPSRWDTILLASRRAGYSEQDLYDAGLAQRNRSHPPRPIDRFRRQVMFPLADRRGRVLGFSGRRMGDGDGPKYVNSAESDLFHKRSLVYGEDVARAPAAKASRVILAEGYTDVLALNQIGLKETVACMGTALTEQQVRSMARMAPTILLALDSDAAGQSAMLKAAEVASGVDAELRVVPMPAGLDPADLVREQGAGAMRALVDGAIPFVRFRVDRELAAADADDPTVNDRIFAALREVMAPVGRGALREDLERRIAHTLRISEGTVAASLAPSAAGGAGGNGRGSAATGGSSRGRITPREHVERAFLAACVAFADHGGRERLAALDGDAALSTGLHRRALEHLRARPGAPADGIADEDGELRTLMAELTVRAGRMGDDPRVLEVEWLKLRKKALEGDMANARAAGTGIPELRREHMEVQRAFLEATAALDHRT